VCSGSEALNHRAARERSCLSRPAIEGFLSESDRSQTNPGSASRVRQSKLPPTLGDPPCFNYAPTASAATPTFRRIPPPQESARLSAPSAHPAQKACSQADAPTAAASSSRARAGRPRSCSTTQPPPKECSSRRAAPPPDECEIPGSTFRCGITKGGLLAAVIQLPHAERATVSPSPFKSLESLAPVMQLVSPAKLHFQATAAGFKAETEPR
jgi:hypothetical protein